MRLHNRQIKASFWNDPDILQWHRDQRTFYIGLVQLADDSGCLEDSPFAFKVQLYPSPMDADITVEVIKGWRDQLVACGRLIPYQADGKACLYLRNFHKHQKLDNPSPPEVPLPPWITWHPYPSNKKAGRYSLDETPLAIPYESLTATLQPEPEPEKEPEGKKDTPAAAAAGKTPTPAPVAATYPADFEEFWQEYPRKTEKRAAFKAWKARLKGGVAPAVLITAAKNYGAGCRADATDERYIKHPATFLGPNRPYEEYIQPRAAPGLRGEARAGKYESLIIG